LQQCQLECSIILVAALVRGVEALGVEGLEVEAQGVEDLEDLEVEGLARVPVQQAAAVEAL